MNLRLITRRMLFLVLLITCSTIHAIEHPVIITDRYLQALQFTYDLHKQQLRKGGSIPYLSHLEAVASIVWKNKGTETEAIAALLHDAAEDQGGIATLNLIRQKFGNEVAQIVADCSDSFDEIKADWLTRKQNYINAMASHSASSRLVAAADKLDNLRDMNREYTEMGDKMWSKFKGTKQQTIWYYKTLGEIFVRVGPANIGHEILDQVALLEAKSRNVE